MEFSAEPGSFDYILCHGVYSWVPAPVQQRIFELCQRLLSPRGIAYISYNTYPGFYRRQPIIEMMHLSHPRPRPDRPRRDRETGPQQLLAFLIASTPDSDGTSARLLREEATPGPGAR